MRKDFTFWLLVAGIAAAMLAGIVGVSMFKEIIADFEGLRLVPYKDSAGLWTIGYGHKIVAGDPYAPYGPVKEITEAQAAALLDHDSARARQAVFAYVTAPLTANQVDALTSLVYNIGSGAFSNSTLVKLINTGDFNGAADEFDKWVHSGGKKIGGLVNRRASEKELFLS